MPSDKFLNWHANNISRQVHIKTVCDHQVSIAEDTWGYYIYKRKKNSFNYESTEKNKFPERNAKQMKSKNESILSDIVN